MTKPPIRDAAGVQRWTCDACGYYGRWTDDHQTYASLRDIDESKWENVLVTCSDACRARLVQLGRVPADATTIRRGVHT